MRLIHKKGVLYKLYAMNLIKTTTTSEIYRDESYDTWIRP